MTHVVSGLALLSLGHSFIHKNHNLQNTIRFTCLGWLCQYFTEEAN